MLKVAIIQDQRKFEHCWARICAAMGPKWTIAGEAGGVKEGIELIYKTRPDLVILNPHLPDGSGFAVFEATTELEYRKALLSEGNRLKVKAARYNATVHPLYMPEEELAHSLALPHGCMETGTVQQMYQYQVHSHPQPTMRLDFCIVPDGKGKVGFCVPDLLAVVKEGGDVRVHLKSGESWLGHQNMRTIYKALAGHPISSDFRERLIYLPNVQDLDTDVQAALVRFCNGQALAIERAFLPILSNALDHFRQSGVNGNA